MSESLQISRFVPTISSEVIRHQLSKQFISKALGRGSFEHGLQPESLAPYSYKLGEMVLCRRDTEEWIRWTSPPSMLMLEVPDHALLAIAQEIGSEPIEIEGTSCLEDKRIAALIAAAEAEEECGFLSGRLYMDALGQGLAAALIQAHGSVRKTLRSYNDGLTPAQLRRVKEHINQQLDYDISAQELAGTVGLSSAYFSQMFRRSAGCTPHQFVLQARMDRAKQMLRRPELRVIDIAVACGFRTSQHFARVFLRFCNVTPTEYRRGV